MAPVLRHRVPLWSLDRTHCLMLHLERILAYKTLCTRSVGWQRRQEEMMSLPGEYLWIWYLIYSTLAKAIPYCYLWPTLMLNVCLRSNIRHWTWLLPLHAGWHNSAAPEPFPLNPSLLALSAYCKGNMLFIDSDILGHLETVQVKTANVRSEITNYSNEYTIIYKNEIKW